MSDRKRQIIPIASGKGGVGKSVLAANLAIALAQKGLSVIAADLDLGGSNLHSCLGAPNRLPGVGDRLRSDEGRLLDLLAPVGIPNLKFLPGDGRMPFMADLSRRKMTALLKEIAALPADFILLDLGAGAVLNTLQAFGMTHTGLMVASFETPSIMNLVMFLKNFMFRVVAGAVYQDKASMNIVSAAFRRSSRLEPLTVQRLIASIAAVNPESAQRAENACAAYRPRIVFNMGDRRDELRIARKIDHTLKNGLSLTADFFGYIPYDEAVRKAAKRREVLLLQYPDSPAAASIREMAHRAAAAWDRPIEDSANALMETARGGES